MTGLEAILAHIEQEAQAEAQGLLDAAQAEAQATLERAQEEAQRRWGDTDEWAQSEARRAAMSASDWKRVKEESDRLLVDLAAAMREGAEPGGERANALAERHRASIDQWFDPSHSKPVLIPRG